MKTFNQILTEAKGASKMYVVHVHEHGETVQNDEGDDVHVHNVYGVHNSKSAAITHAKELAKHPSFAGTKVEEYQLNHKPTFDKHGFTNNAGGDVVHSSGTLKK